MVVDLPPGTCLLAFSEGNIGAGATANPEYSFRAQRTRGLEAKAANVHTRLGRVIRSPRVHVQLSPAVTCQLLSSIVERGTHYLYRVVRVETQPVSVRRGDITRASHCGISITGQPLSCRHPSSARTAPRSNELNATGQVRSVAARRLAESNAALSCRAQSPRREAVDGQESASAPTAKSRQCEPDFDWIPIAPRRPADSRFSLTGQKLPRHRATRGSGF